MTKKEQQLVDRENIFKRFIAWEALPLSKRNPKTLNEFMEINSLVKEDISEFINRDDYADLLDDSVIKWAKGKLPEIIHMLYDKIREEKSTKDIIAFKELLDKVDKTKEREGNTNILNIINPTKEQYEQIIAREARGQGLLGKGGTK